MTSAPFASHLSSRKSPASILDLTVHIALVLTGVVTTFLGPLLPALAVRWHLADAQAGSFFTAQFMASIVGAGLTSLILPRRGFRFTLALGIPPHGSGYVGVIIGRMEYGAHIHRGLWSRAWLDDSSEQSHGLNGQRRTPGCGRQHSEFLLGTRRGFIHQYSHAWIDFRGKRDRFADYFDNSTRATRAHIRFCFDLAERFPKYSGQLWGITASDSVHGYVVWGGPPAMGPIDGTVVPSAAAGSLPFLPDQCLKVLHSIRDNYESRCWKRYGFVDSFNPHNSWTNPDVIGINIGIAALMAANLKNQMP